MGTLTALDRRREANRVAMQRRRQAAAEAGIPDRRAIADAMLEVVLLASPCGLMSAVDVLTRDGRYDWDASVGAVERLVVPALAAQRGKPRYVSSFDWNGRLKQPGRG